MKNVFTFLILLLAISASAQTIRRVNNNPGITGTNIFTTIQAAHDAAVNGDIIYVEPSNVSAGTLTCTKNLRIFGNGYFLNFNIQLQNDVRTSRVSDITLNTGSDGTVISGLDVAGNGIIQGFGVSNITVSRNRCRSIDFWAIRPGNTSISFSNITIIQNYIEGCPTTNCGAPGALFVQGVVETSSYFASNILVSNNFIGRDWDPAIVIYNTVTGIAIKNNVIDGIVLVANGSFENNFIIGGLGTFGQTVGPAPAFVLNYASNVVLQNNAGNGNKFPSGYPSSNLNNINPGDHFDVLNGASPDANLRLRSTSILKTAGAGGGEIGIYGGDFPYVISGIPAIPSFSTFNTSAVGSNTTPLSVTISTKSNN
jgi:hypothetical protein